MDHPCIKPLPSAAARGGVDTNKKQLSASQQALLGKMKTDLHTQNKPKTVFTSTDNTVHGTATRRKITSDVTASIPSGLACPYCGLAHSNEVELVNHVESMHSSAPTTTSTTTSTSAAAAASGSERCPVCSQSFTNAVDLVTHFEATHNTTENRKNECNLA